MCRGVDLDNRRGQRGLPPTGPIVVVEYGYVPVALPVGIMLTVTGPGVPPFYLECLGIGLALKSTYLTLASLVAVIPAHIFYLKHFEELELEFFLQLECQSLPITIQRFLHWNLLM